MGKLKQETIDSLAPDIKNIGTRSPNEQFKSAYQRIFMIDGVSVSREDFIGAVANELYTFTSSNDFRETLDILLTDIDGKEMITMGGKNFWSFIELTRDLKNDEMIVVTPVLTEANSPYIPYDVEERPLKHYLVTYDVEVKPLLSFGSKKKMWKRTSEVCLADSFKDAKTQVRQRCHKEGKSTKHLEVIIHEERTSGDTDGDTNE